MKATGRPGGGATVWRSAGRWLPLLALLNACGGADRPIVVGSKNFTESVILGELLAQQLERAGLRVDRRLNLGGTFVCHEAIVAGQLDLYPEYTGTAHSAVLKLPPDKEPGRVRLAVDSAYHVRWQLTWGPPFGFENTFAMLVRRADADRLRLRSLSEAAAHAPDWRAGFGYEFMERNDGYRGLAARYGLRFRTAPAVMDLGLTYRALAAGEVDFIAGNSTDGQIRALDLFPLEDDRRFFPPYEAAPVVRLEILRRYPAVARALEALNGALSAEAMRELNYQVDVQHRGVADVARAFLDRR